jgi:hypothetical protein
LPKPGVTTLQRDDDLPPKDHERLVLLASDDGVGDGDGDGDWDWSGKYAETFLGNCVKVTFEEEAAPEEERGIAERRLVTVLVDESAVPERCTCPPGTARAGCSCPPPLSLRMTDGDLDRSVFLIVCEPFTSNGCWNE